MSAAAGVPQQHLFNEAYLAIGCGTAEVAVVVGGEAALRTATARRAGVILAEPNDDSTEPDQRFVPTGEIVSQAEIAAKVYTPVESYALIESALRADAGHSVDDHRRAVAELWARFAAVAAARQGRSGPPLTAAEIDEVGPSNRMLSLPYTKRHCTQINVDQAAAVVICSEAAARRWGIDPRRVIHPLVAVQSSATVALPRRAAIHRWPAMEVLGATAAEYLGRQMTDLDAVELYSCFPSAVRIQQQALGLPPSGTPTITGGMPFAGGPFNNFVIQATVAMCGRVRAEGGAGLVTTVSGLLNKPGLAVYANEPGERPLLVADLAEACAAATATRPLSEATSATGTIAAWTVSWATTPEPRLIAVIDTDDDARTIAVTSDPSAVERALTTDVHGAAVGFDGPALSLR